MTFVRGVPVVALLAWLGCGGASWRSTTAEISNTDPAAAAAIRIGWREPRVGDVATKTEDNAMRMHFAAGPTRPEIEIARAEQTERRVEVLAVTDGSESSVKVLYRKHRSVETSQGTSRELPTPTLGKTYVVTRVADAVVVTREDGSAPSAEEVSVVAGDHRTVGKPPAMERFLSSTTWKIGVAVALDPAQLVAIGESMSDGVELRAMSLTLRHADDVTATFAMTAILGGPTRDGGALTISATGAAVVERATGRPLSFHSTGPMTGNAAVDLPFEGSVTSKSVYTY